MIVTDCTHLNTVAAVVASKHKLLLCVLDVTVTNCSVRVHPAMHQLSDTVQLCVFWFHFRWCQRRNVSHRAQVHWLAHVTCRRPLFLILCLVTELAVRVTFLVEHQLWMHEFNIIITSILCHCLFRVYMWHIWDHLTALWSNTSALLQWSADYM